MTESSNANVRWAADDLTLIEAMSNELESYIVDSQVYRTLMLSGGSGNQKVMMSGGDLLARINRLRENYQSLAPEQQGRFDTVASKVQSTIYSLRTRFHELLRRELKSRSDQLHWNEDVRRAGGYNKADSAEIHNQQHIAAIQAELNQ